MRTPAWKRACTFGVLLIAALLQHSAASAQGAAIVSGRVIDGISGTPVPGAVVEATGGADARTVSDLNGRWSISLPAGTNEVRVTHASYTAAQVSTMGGGALVEVRLMPTATLLDALVVTGGRRLERLADVSVATDLVSRSDIEKSGVSDLSQVLMTRLGIQLDPGVASGEGIMLQGMSSERVLILLDGQPLVGRISGNLDISRIPASAVEQIEVVKGPQSSLYGSEAMGGVVNIITRRGGLDSWRGGLDMTAGTQGRLDGSASLSGTLAGVTYVADGGRRLTELTPGRASSTGALAERWDGLFKASGALSRNFSVESSALVLDERQKWQTGQLHTFSDNRQISAQLGGEWVLGSHRLAPALYLSQFEHHSRRATSAQPVPGTGEFETQRLTEAELQYSGEFAAASVTAGVEAKREFIVSDRVQGEERTLHTVEPFAQLSTNLGPLRLVPGARLTWSEQWGTNLSPSLATLFRPVPSVAIRSSVGLGYRAPAFKELGMEFLNLSGGTGYRVRGNPDLQPETSLNLSLGAEYTGHVFHGRAQLFANEFEDFIETRLVGDSSGITVYQYGNIADGVSRGVELEGGAVLGASRVEAGYAFLYARDGATGSPLMGRPAHSGRLMVEHVLPFDLRASATAVYTGETPLEETSQGTTMRSSFARIDVNVNRSLPGGLRASLGARNILDTAPDQWAGYDRRHLYMSVRWELSAPVVR